MADDWRGKWDDIGDRETRLTYLRRHWPELVAAIQDEARRAFLDELIVTGVVTAPMSFDELEEVLERHRLRMFGAFTEQQKGEVAPSNLGGTDG